MLARLKSKPGETKQNWLLFKEHDLAASETVDILKERPESVKSGLRIDELVARPPTARPATAKPAALRPGTLPGAVKAPLPARIEPQLANLVAGPPSLEGWLHEIKFDGYRTMAHLLNGEARFITRGGLDWTKRYGDLKLGFALLPCKEAIIDGEVVVLDAQGISRFGALQDALAAGETHRLVFYAFDLLHLNGWDISKAPLERRKALLAQLLAGHAGGNSALQFSDHIAGDGRPLYEKAAELGLEGVVSKRASAPYISGRSHSWTKAKALKSGDFVIAGYSTSQAAEGLAALGVAEWVDGGLQYRGKVGTGFDTATARSLEKRLEALRDDSVTLDGAPKEIKPVRPMLSAHIHFSNRTTDNMLRHAVFKGLREVELSHSGAAERERLISDTDLAGIWVTNPTRRLFGKSGPTKLDIAVYYAAVGDFMLPHILGRPVSLFRCPSGNPKDCFFQRHAFKGMPPTIAVFETKNSDEEDKTYVAVEDAKGYLALAQFGVVEFHAWGCLRQHLDRPDRIVFDLDPGEGIGWREIVEAAAHVRGELKSMGLTAFAKTSGGKGVHVVVPIVKKPNWKQVHQATGEIAERIAKTAPQTFTTVMGKDNRKRQIFIDFHRNARSATAVAPYSMRARAHATVSTPLSWDDLESIDGPEDLNYSSVPGLVAASGDPWDDINQFAAELPAIAKARK